MLLSLCGGVGGLQSHFRVQPNDCVEVMLRSVVVGVVTIFHSSLYLGPQALSVCQYLHDQNVLEFLNTCYPLPDTCDKVLVT